MAPEINPKRFDSFEIRLTGPERCQSTEKQLPLFAGCDAPVDLGILFESQTDVWSTVKRMLNQTIHSKMAITSGHTHVSLKVIGEDNVLLKFDQLKGPELNAKKVWDAIQTIQTRRHNGKLSTALVQAKDMFKAKNGGREGAMKVSQ